MNFDQSADYLLSLGNEVIAMKLGLENVGRLLAALGDPQKNFLKVQVAGTNGKGSVCAFVDAVCRSAGVKTGLYISPHLISITERIRIDGREISEADFARQATKVRRICEGLVRRGELDTVPTYFEQVTAIGLAAFAEAGVRVAILETGLGGRLDAVTAAAAEIAAVSRIDLDHQEYLGETIEEIAAEKIAIVRPDSKVCIGRQMPQVMSVIRRHCAAVGVTPKTLAGAVWNRGSAAVDFDDIVGWNGAGFVLGLDGEHQIENAALAILVANELKSFLPIADMHIRSGLEAARHPGRLEWTGRSGVRVLLDGAHNESGARALAAYLTDEQPNAKFVLVYGAMRGKNYESILRILSSLAAEIILTEPQNPRSILAAELAAAEVFRLSNKRVSIVSNVEEALNAAFRSVENFAADGPAFVLVTGSLYLVGEAKRIVDKKVQVR